MPVVSIKLWTGQSQTTKEKIAKKDIDLLATEINTSKDSVLVLFQDIDQNNWFKGNEDKHN